MSSTINYGIDLGTTNSAIAKFEKGELVIYKNPQSLKETTSSAVAYRKDRIIIGDKAREMTQKDSANVFSHFKRKMGTDYTYHVPNTQQTVSPIDLSAEILKELKQVTQSDTEILSTIITIPAAFDTIQSNATKQAGFKAGFKEVFLLQEPIAASIAYTNKGGFDITEGKWLVYDLGGGTFDIALVGIHQDELKVFDHEGDNYLGGTDFDHSVVRNIIAPKIQAETGVDLLSMLEEGQAAAQKLYNVLLYKAEELKKELGHQASAEIEIDLSSIHPDFDEIYFSIPRQEFDAAVLPIINKTITLTKSLLEKNELRPTDIKKILLVGGSTYVPAVKDTLAQQLGIALDGSIDPITAIVTGAAYYAGSKTSFLTDSQSQQSKSTPNDLKVKIAYNKMSVLDQEMLLIISEGDCNHKTLRVTSTDGRYDSGKLALEPKHILHLPLLANAINVYELNIYNSDGTKHEQSSTLSISHGKYNISGQPLPEDICIELDSPEMGRTYLQPIFKKNDILPLRKTITKQLVQTISKGSDQSFTINVMEGSYSNAPNAAKLIGKLVIKGTDLSRDLVKGSDIDLRFEMTESRDLSVNVYLRMIDQEFDNVFDPKMSSVDVSDLKQSIYDLQKEASHLISKSESDENYSRAAALLNHKTELQSLLDDLAKLSGKTHDEDAYYQIDRRRRDLAACITSQSYTSVFTDLIDKYYNYRGTAEQYLKSPLAKESDQEVFNRIVADQDNIVKSSDYKYIKYRVEELKSLINQISNRKELTDNDIIFYYISYKNYNYVDKTTANAYIVEGEQAMAEQNIMKIKSALYNLVHLYQKENPDDHSSTFTAKTGLK